MQVTRSLKQGLVQPPRLCSLKELGPYRCVVSFSRFFGRLMIIIASNGHFCAHPIPSSPYIPAFKALLGCACQQRTFTQIPQPMHSSSEIQAVFEVGATSMHSLPACTNAFKFLR